MYFLVSCINLVARWLRSRMIKKEQAQEGLSRQRQWQLAKLEDGLCSICGDNPLGTSATMCDECYAKHLERKKARYEEKKKEREIRERLEEGK